MDVITHALLGVTISEATFRRRIGRSAAWLAAAAAACPDLDVLTQRFDHDPWVMLAAHRGATHALIMAPLLALLCTAVFWAVRRRQFWPMFLLALLAVVSHPLLDLLTSYGTQIFWPFTNQRYAFDILPIVDIFFTPILALAILTAWVVRWRQSRNEGEQSPYKGEPGRPRPRSSLAPQVVAIIGLLLALGYAGVGVWADQRTRNLAMATVPADHGRVLAIRCGPLLGSTFARRLAVKTEHGFYVARYNLLRSTGDPEWHWAPDDSDNQFVKLANEQQHIKLFRWFAMGMARAVVENSNGNGHRLVRVSYYDMRYGYPADSDRSLFAAYVIFDADSKELLVAPTSPRWSGRAQASEAGVAEFFKSPATQPDLSQGEIWARIVTLWREMWRP